MLVPPLVDTCAGAEFYRWIRDKLGARFSLGVETKHPLARANRSGGQR